MIEAAELESFLECVNDVDCDTLKKLLLVESECDINLSVCEALGIAVKKDEDGNIFLDVPIRIRAVEFHASGENPIVAEDTVWDDIRVPVSTIRLSGAQPPTATAFKGSSVLAFPSNANKTIFFIAQVPHMWKEETDLEFHIHWALPTAGAGVGAENIKWDFTYSKAVIDGTFPVETAETITIDVQNTAIDLNTLSDVVDIDMSGDTISVILLCSLTRDVTVANDYADDVYLIEVDFHYQKNSIGSKEELIK